MKKISKAWNLVFDWLGNGKKIIIGIIFIAVGFVWNFICYSEAGLGQPPLIIMLAGGLLLVNALMSKLVGTNINPLLYILICIVMLELGLFLMEDEEIDFTNMVAIWGACYIFTWALQYCLLEAAEVDGIAKRIVIAFFEVLLGVVALGVVFGGPVIIAALL